MRKFKVTASSNSYTLKVTPYVINKGQSGEYYGLKNAEDNQVLTSAPNNWKSKKGAIAWAKKKGYEVVESACGKKSVKADWVSKGKKSKISKSFELSDFFLFELGKDFIGISINNSYPEGKSWLGARTISCSDAKGLFDYLRNSLTDDATWYQIERTVANSGFDAKIDTMGNFVSDKEMRKPVTSSYNKKSVKANTAKRRKAIKASDDYTSHPNGYSRDDRFRLAGDVLQRAGISSKPNGAALAYYLPGNYVLTFNSQPNEMTSQDLIFTIWNPNAKDEFDYAGILYTDLNSANRGDDATEALFNKGFGSLPEREEFSNTSNAFKKALDWVISKAMSRSDVNSSKKFGVKASKSAKRRKAIKADWEYDESYENNYYDEIPEDIKRQLNKEGDRIEELKLRWYEKFEELHPGERVGLYDEYPDVDEAVGYTRDDAQYNSRSIKAASGYFADDLNADSNYKILQTLRTAMFDKYDGKVLDGVELQVYRPQKAGSEYSYYFKIEFVSTDNVNDSISLYVISDAQSRGKFLCVLTEYGLAEPFESKWSGAQDTFKIPMSGSKNVLSQEIERIAAELSDNNIGASTKRRNGTKVTAAWYEGGDIVMYFNGEKIYEGQPGADMYDAILPLCQDDETRLKFQEWCNQFGDPLFDDEYGDASETAYTFCELIYYDFVDDENNYEDGNGILDFEIFPATEEVTGTKSVKCASENISAAEYNQMLADMTLGILHDDGYEGIGCAVTDEALSFYDGTEDDVVYIQPTDEITPILGDEDADAEELAAAVKSVAGKAVEATTYEDLEPINGEDEDYGYGFDSNGEAISESTVDELYRIAEREVLPTTELAKVDEYATIMEDTFEYYASSPYVGVTYTISATFDTDDIDVVSYALPDAYHYDFRGGKEVGELEFYIYVKGNEIDKVELIWNSSNLDPDNYDMEAIEEYVKGIAKPAAEAIYNAITNI